MTEHTLTVTDHRLFVAAAHCSCGDWEIGGDIPTVEVIALAHAVHVQRQADLDAIEAVLDDGWRSLPMSARNATSPHGAALEALARLRGRP